MPIGIGGEIGWWEPSLDDTGNGTTTLYDLAGSSNGALINMDAATDWVADTASGGSLALDFDGVNDYVSIPNTRTHSSGSELTISCWVKRNAASVYYELVTKFVATSAANEDGWLLRWDSANKLTWTVAQSGGYDTYVSSSAYTTTDWAHVAVTHKFGSSANTALYLNGAVVSASYAIGTGTRIPDADATSDAILLGVQRYAGVSYNLLAGRLDGVRIFYSILSAATIAKLASRRAYQPGTSRRKINDGLFNRGLFNAGLTR